MKIALLVCCIVFILVLITPYINIQAFMAFFDSIGFIGEIFKPIVQVISILFSMLLQYSRLFMLVCLAVFLVLASKLMDLF